MKTKVYKTFYLGREQAEIIEYEAKKRGISQSELINELTLNIQSEYNKAKLDKIEELFNDIRQIHKDALKQNKLVAKAIRYLINEDEQLKRKVMFRAKERYDYNFMDFLLS